MDIISQNSIILGAVTLGLLLIAREVICWYNKSTEQVNLLKKILAQLEKQNNPENK